MFHYIYKIESDTGKYYFGRHSTNNLNDGYVGSGKWIRNELKEAEEKYLKLHIGKENCMNFNNNSCGFSCGELSPSKSFAHRERMRQFLLTNNPNNNPESVRKRSETLKGRPAKNKGVLHSEEAKKKISEGRKNCKYSEEGKRKLSISRKRQYENGERVILTFKDKKHTIEYKEYMKNNALQRERKICEYCHGKFKPHTYKRWHGDNCKAKKS